MSRLFILVFVLGGAWTCGAQCIPLIGCIGPERKEGEMRSLIQTLPDYNEATIFGDWNGARKKLAEQGVLFDFELTQIMQGVFSGARDNNDAIAYSGSPDFVLGLDLARMGLWEGGLIYLRAESQLGHGINQKVCSVIPSNFDAVLPVPDQSGVTTLSEFYYAQALSEKFVLVLGKVDIIGGRDSELLGTMERNWFLNTGMRTNPGLAPYILYTPLIAGGLFIPNKWFRVLTGIMDNDPRGAATTTGFETAFHGRDWYTLIQQYEFTVKPFGKPGHQFFGWTWTSRNLRLLENTGTCSIQAGELLDLNLWRIDQDIRLAQSAGLPPFFKDYWDAPDDAAVFYRFDQFLYTEPNDPNQGFGVFGRYAGSNGKGNPIEGFYSLGIGGLGLIPNRDHDITGVGFYHVNLSDNIPNILKIHSETGIEAFYNIRIRPGLYLTPDIQVIINPGAGLGDRPPAVIYGLRLQAYF